MPCLAFRIILYSEAFDGSWQFFFDMILHCKCTCVRVQSGPTESVQWIASQRQTEKERTHTRTFAFAQRGRSDTLQRRWKSTQSTKIAGDNAFIALILFAFVHQLIIWAAERERIKSTIRARTMPTRADFRSAIRQPAVFLWHAQHNANLNLVAFLCESRWMLPLCRLYDVIKRWLCLWQMNATWTPQIDRTQSANTKPANASTAEWTWLHTYLEWEINNGEPIDGCVGTVGVGTKAAVVTAAVSGCRKFRRWSTRSWCCVRHRPMMSGRASNWSCLAHTKRALKGIYRNFRHSTCDIARYITKMPQKHSLFVECDQVCAQSHLCRENIVGWCEGQVFQLIFQFRKVRRATALANFVKFGRNWTSEQKLHYLVPWNFLRTRLERFVEAFSRDRKRR